MLEKGGSDLHLTVGLPPKSRISGSLQPIGDSVLDAKTMEGLLKEICPERRWHDYLDRKDLDLAHEVAGLARFRGNFLYNHWGQAAVFRQIPAKILSFDDLKLLQVAFGYEQTSQRRKSPTSTPALPGEAFDY